MSQNAINMRLEDLEIKPYLLNKLKSGGIESIFDLAISIPHQLIDVGCVLADTDGQTALELVMKAKKALIDAGLLAKEFSTAEQILERRKNLIKCTTGSSKLDSFLKGGIESQAMTEFAGEFGSGKSQLCYTLCVTANMPTDKSGLGGNVIFIDTENTFRAERIHQIAENTGVNEPQDILRKIYVCKIYNSNHLELIIQNLGKSIQEYKAKLVIVDSIIALHRAEFTGRGTLADRQQRLNIMLHKLTRLAEVHNIAVVITNQVQSQPDTFFAGGDGLRATGGNIMGHASTYRIFLRKAGRDRIAIMIDSPCHAYDQTRFAIAEGGVQDVQEYKNTVSEW
ncbi:MAG: DNA repair and recombination protein RadA, partial [Candidatus Nitrosopolaris sp.]|jgi:DNA repair protein RadA